MHCEITIIVTILDYVLAENHLRYLKHKIDALDLDSYECKYTLIEGDVLGVKIESIDYEVKVKFGASQAVRLWKCLQDKKPLPH